MFRMESLVEAKFGRSRINVAIEEGLSLHQLDNRPITEGEVGGGGIGKKVSLRGKAASNGLSLPWAKTAALL